VTAIASPPVFVNGVSFWSPRMPGWEIASTVLAGDAPPPAGASRRPSPALLPSAERRRAPDAVAIAIEVAARACDAAMISPATLPAVFATAHGDLSITDYLCAILIDSPLHTSPTRFHNSVHNAAAGYWCIASGCHAPYTTVSVAGYSYAAGLLEAFTQVIADGRPVLYVAYDTEACGPLATTVTSHGLLGAGLVLAPVRSAGTIAELAWSVRPGGADEITAPRPENTDLVGDNAMVPCLPLFEALARDAGPVTLGLGPGSLLELRLQSR
jgi:hypothetical protein